MATWRIECMAAADLCAEIPAESVDFVHTDPPYGIASADKAVKRSNGGPGPLHVAAFDLAWDADLPLDWIAPMALTVRKGGAGIIWTDANATHLVRAALNAAGLEPRQNVYWRKLYPPPQPRKNFQSGIEVGIFWRKPGANLICWRGGGSAPNVVDAGICPASERLGHPTQKPLAVGLWAANLLMPAGGTFLDPFTGSGTFAAAAVMQGAGHVIAGDLDPQWAAVTQQRLEDVAAGRVQRMHTGRRTRGTAGQIALEV